jgi:hypothetical protein
MQNKKSLSESELQRRFLFCGIAVSVCLVVIGHFLGVDSPAQSSATPAQASHFVLNGNDTDLVSDNMAQMPGDILGSRLHLVIDRSSPAMLRLTVKNGDIVCGNNDDVYIQFDGRPNETFGCQDNQEAEESLSNGPVYIDIPDEMIGEIKGASSMTISPLILGKGRVNFTFNASSE